ncbi:MAG: topoisomerase II [Actinomycetales bacterium]|nr:topoisomerase II [Actinomycetales bacterium]
MGKKSSAKRTQVVVAEGADVPVVGMREPCPCGSGRRYKACHGKAAAAAFVGATRPFEGMASECDIVAMREIVPAASTKLALTGEHADRDVTLVTVLPLAWPALVRQDGSILLGLQVNVGSGDASRDLADALLGALEAQPGDPVSIGRVTAESPRLQDLVDPDAVLDITVHENFDFWVDESVEATDDVRASLERASAYAHPTVRLSSVPSAYWTQMGEKEYLRWVLPQDEDVVLNGLARLHAAGADTIGEGTRCIGMFRTQGVVVPVWELPVGTGASAIEAEVADLAGRLDTAMASTEPLTSDERRARAGFTTRQITLR